MRAILPAIVLVLLAAFASTALNASNELAIRTLLTKPQSWTMYVEYTDEDVPSDRAQRMTWHYFVQDGRTMGRQAGVPFGGCEFEISVRADGFSFPWCAPYKGMPSLEVDPSDPVYPFKSRNPRKIWLKPNE